MDVIAEPLATLRHRTSEKWTAYPAEVLPLFVAEMDYPLAPGISRVLHERIAASDSGYVGSPGELPVAFADFADALGLAASAGWHPDDHGCERRHRRDASPGGVPRRRHRYHDPGVSALPRVHP